MHKDDKQTVACHISVISSNLGHISRAIEKQISNDAEFEILDRLMENVYIRLEEIEFTLNIWGDTDCSCDDCRCESDPWYKFDRKGQSFHPSDYRMD